MNKNAGSSPFVLSDYMVEFIYYAVSFIYYAGISMYYVEKSMSLCFFLFCNIRVAEPHSAAKVGISDRLCPIFTKKHS